MGKSTRAGNPQQITAMAKVVRATLAGLTRQRAADYAGVDRLTIYRWLDREVMPGPVYERFRNVLMRAEAWYIQRELRVIQAAARIPNAKTGQTDWRASAWLMEHRFQFEFGPKATIEHTGPGGGPIQTEDKTLSDPQVKERLEEVFGILREVGKVDLVTNGHRPGESEEVLK